MLEREGTTQAIKTIPMNRRVELVDGPAYESFEQKQSGRGYDTRPGSLVARKVLHYLKSFSLSNSVTELQEAYLYMNTFLESVGEDNKADLMEVYSLSEFEWGAKGFLTLVGSLLCVISTSFDSYIYM